MIKAIQLFILVLISTINSTAQLYSGLPQDTQILTELFNSTNGQGWSNHSGWLNSEFRNWYGINEDYYYCETDCEGYYGVASVRLRGNKLSGLIPASIADLSELGEIDLSHNNLRGSIPASLANEAIDALDLSYNKLTGEVPLDLYLSRENAYLDLSHNELIGTIPEDISVMEEIEYLNLSYNKLSGRVPVGIMQLKNNDEPLQSLDISHNRFNFDGMELLAQEVDFAIYAPQDFIPINFKNCQLSVTAGGTLENNTYTWYRDGILVDTKTGDSTYTPLVAGSYRVDVTNSIAGALTLHSKEISPAIVAWAGFTDNRWENAANWLCSVLPDSTTDLVFDQGQEVILNSGETCKSLTVKPGAAFTLTSYGSLNIYGDKLIPTVLRIDVKDGHSWNASDTVLKPASQTTIKLFSNLQDVTDNSPAYTFITNDSGFIEVQLEFADNYYFTAEKENAGNIYDGYLVQSIFQTQAEVNNSAIQNPTGTVGGVRLTDINQDGTIDVNDVKTADIVELKQKSKVSKTIVVY